MTTTSETVACATCGHQVAVSARTCPSCGVRWPARHGAGGASYAFWSAMGVIVALAALVIGLAIKFG